MDLYAIAWMDACKYVIGSELAQLVGLIYDIFKYFIATDMFNKFRSFFWIYHVKTNGQIYQDKVASQEDYGEFLQSSNHEQSPDSPLLKPRHFEIALDMI